MSIGSVRDGDEIARGVEATLRAWMPSVLAELRERKGLDERLAREPVEWRRLSDEEIFNLESSQSPTIAVVTGPAEDPHRDSDGLWKATWSVGAFVFVRGDNFEETHQLTHLYMATMRTCLLQHGIDLVGAGPVRLTGEQPREVVSEAARSIGYGVVRIAVPVAAITDDSAGPLAPPSAPAYPDLPEPEAETAHVEVEPLV